MQRIINILTFSLLFVCVLLAAIEFYPVLLWGIKHCSVYKWFGAGFVSYFVLRLIPFVKKNGELFQTFTHELTHTIVAVMFFRKIHSFHAEERSGVMEHSGGRFGDIFISLAPYCLPVFSYAFLLLRIIGAWRELMWFDIFIGITVAFHGTCFSKQTGNYQTDIERYGYLKSYLFIVVCWLFHATIILLSIRKGIVNSVCYLFQHYWSDIVMSLKYIF
jgi:hypothetical protein